MLGDLSTHFWSKEFRCPCKKCMRKKARVSSLFLHKLEMMIIIIDEPYNIHIIFTILSGNRCEQENERIGGWPNSAHIPKPEGEGADCMITGMKPIELGLIAEKVGGLRIGIANWGVHLDTKLPCPSKFWYYDSRNIPIYSAKINNKSLIEFYNRVKGK
ncbi:hypothetical protein KAR91_04945 [Candidatus Pacearchaeota archaeon]|nr:hypothetical protein [Candidatus Pacearchaeota archaeon]